MQGGRLPSHGSRNARTQRGDDDRGLSLQGQQVAIGSGSDPYGLGINASVSALGLCYESSGDSSTSSSLLPPVPSLPGIHAPAAGPSGSQQLHLVKKSAAAGTSISPVKLKAWQNERKASQQQAGSLSSYSLPKELQSTSKAVLGNSSPTATKRSISNQALPPVRSSSSPKASYSPKQQQTTTKTWQAGSVGPSRSSVQQQVPKGNQYDGAEHLTTLVLPAGVVTGEDAIKYFASGAGKPSDLIYCNLAVPCSPCLTSNGQQASASSETAVGARGQMTVPGSSSDGVYKPYDLVAVSQQEANKLQHFIVSYNGVMHMRAGEPPEQSSHAEWLRQKELFNVLSQLSCFKQYRVRMAFGTWRSNVLRQKFTVRSKQLSARLLARHAGVASCLQRAHSLLESYLTAEVGDAVYHATHLLQTSQRAAMAHEFTPSPSQTGSTVSTASGPPTAVGPTDALPGQSSKSQVAASASEGQIQSSPAPAGQPSKLATGSSALPGQAPAAAADNQQLPSARATSERSSRDGSQIQGGDAPAVDAVWSKSAATGRWKLVAQVSRRSRTSSLLTQPQHESGQPSNLPPTDSMAAVDTRAVLGPQGGNKAAGAAIKQVGSQARESNANMPAVEALELLLGVTKHEGLLTVADLSAWRARMQPAVATAMGQLHTQLMSCLQQLEHSGNERIRSEAAAAAAAEQTAKETGNKPPLPWNEAVTYNSKVKKRELARLLARVARVLDVMATSHAARMTAAATAHLLSTLVLPRDPQEALQLCPHQFKGLLAAQKHQLQQLREQHSSGLKFKVQAVVRQTEELLAEQQQAGPGAVVDSLRFTPDCEELTAAVSNVPTVITTMVNALPLLSNEPSVALWRQLGKSSSNQQHLTSLSHASAEVEPQGVADTPMSIADGSVDASNRQLAVGGVGLRSQRAKSFKARNARLDVLMSSSGALRIQASLANLIDQHFTSTRTSMQLQPLRDVTPLVLLCSKFDPDAYLQLQTSARQLAADVTAVGSWLGQLRESSVHSVSVAHSTGCESLDAGGQCRCWGLVVMDVCHARAALLKMAGGTLGSLLSILHGAYMRHCQQLLSQIDAAIATLNQRPDTLETFTAWLATVLGHFLPGVAAGMGTGRGLSMMMARDSVELGQGLQDQPKQRAVLLAEFEALRLLLDIMRPGSGNSIAGLIAGSASMRPGSPGYEATEAAAVSLRQLGPGPVRAAATALSELQARVIAYKDVTRIAGGYAATGAKSLAPSMTAYMTKAQEQLVDLLVQLRTGDPSKSSCAAAVALLQIDRLKEQRAELLKEHEQHLLAAELFKEKSVVSAVQAFDSLSSFLSDHLAQLADLRSAQLAWASQLEAMYQTSAVSEACMEELQQLDHCCQELLRHVQRIEMLKPGDDVCCSSTATADEAHLAAAVRLELAAWQARLPLGSIITDTAMQPRHRMLLFQLMLMAETGVTVDLLPDFAVYHSSSHSPTDASIQSLDLAADVAYVQRSLQHYGLAKLDRYHSVYLANAAAPGQSRGSDDSSMEPSEDGSYPVNPHKGLAAASPLWRYGSDAGYSSTAADSGNASVAALLVWLSRSGQATAVLHRVLQLAQGEQQLCKQVTTMQDMLSSLSLHLSNGRVAGCFMFTNLQQLTNSLQGVQMQMELVAGHECHVGCAGQLLQVQALQQEMSRTVKACDMVQSRLLALHNLFHHPALRACLTLEHQAAYTAAIKGWSAAVLKVRSSSSSSGAGHNPRRSSTGDESTNQGQVGGVKCYSLLRHMGTLTLAAESAQVAIHKARLAAGQVMATKLCSHWPRLGLAPQESLLQLIEQLPASLRAAAAQQPVPIPLPLADVLFRGVTHFIPAQRPADIQVLALGGPEAKASKHQQRRHAAGRLSAAAGTAQTAEGSKPPGSACSIVITGDGRGGGSAPEHVTTVSGCMHEPLAAGDPAGTMVVQALGCFGRDSSVGGTAAADAIEVLPLQLPLKSTEQNPTGHAAGQPAPEASRLSLQQQLQQSGIVWRSDTCPAAVLRVIHEAAKASLRHQTYQAIQTAGTTSAEQWAGSCCLQALLLADSVLWTRAATSSLQQLAAGNSHALRALLDSAVVQLENVTTALRRNRQLAGDTPSVQPPGDRSAGAVTSQQAASQVLLVQDSKDDCLQQQLQLQGRERRKSSIGNRPATPDTPEPPPQQPAQRQQASSSSTTINSSSSSRRTDEGYPVVSDHCPVATDQHTNNGLSLCVSTASVDSTSSTSKGLTPQQLRGLQLLVAAGTCHREVATRLVATGVKGPSDFEWGQQLRYYWQADKGQLQVCFGPCQVQYGWEYCPASTSSLIQPLVSALLSRPSLLAAAAAAIDLPPVVGLDLTSMAAGSMGSQLAAAAAAAAGAVQPGTQAASLTAGLQIKGRGCDCRTSGVVGSMSGVVDVLASVQGLQALHFNCSPSTSSKDLKDWLAALAAAALGDDSAVGELRCGVFGSVSGLCQLDSSVLAAFSIMLCQLQQQLARPAAQGQDDDSLRNPGSIRLPNGSLISLGWLAIFCEVPAHNTASDHVSHAAWGQNARAEVLNVVQQYGRCVSVQPPSLVMLLECVFRQMGLVDCADAASLLAIVLQQASEIESDPALNPASRTPLLAQHRKPGTGPGKPASSCIGLASLQQLQQRLIGLQTIGRPEAQPGCSAWGVLQMALEQCVLPRLPSHSHTELLQTMESGLQAAIRLGRVTKPVSASAEKPHLSLAVQQQPSATSVGRGICVQLCSDMDVQQAVTELCQHGRKGVHPSAADGTSRCTIAVRTSAASSYRSSVASQLDTPVTTTSGTGNDSSQRSLPAMNLEAAVAVCSSIHTALQLHGACLLVGPNGIGTTLAWQTLRAAYNAIAAAKTGFVAPVWVWCYPQVLLEDAGSSAVTAEQLEALLSSYHASALQCEWVKQQQDVAGAAAEEGRTTETAQLSNLSAGAASAIPNILVLDVQQISGPLLHLLSRLLQQQSRRSLTAQLADQQPLWQQLPGCCGIVIECVGTALTDFDLGQQLQAVPVVAVRPPGLLDSKQQLARELRAAFKPLAVLPQSPHCSGITPASGSASRGASAAGGGGSEGLKAGCGGNTARYGVPVGSCGAGLQVTVPKSMLDSLAALLQDLVGAGLEVAAARDSFSSEGTTDSWQANRRILDCCRDAVGLAGAMWAQSTPCQATNCEPCCIASSSSSSWQDSSSGSGIGRSSTYSDPSAPATPSEQFAAQLLVFCASWVIAGHCSSQQQMSALKQTLSAVLAGAGFSWAEPPAALGGLFSARLDLASGRWVSWVEDVSRLASRRRPSSISSSGLDLSANPAPAGAASHDALPLPYHICKLESSMVGSADSPLAGAYNSSAGLAWQQGSSCWAAADSYNPSCSPCGTWRPGRLFIASARACALQYLVYWFIEAGKSPLLMAGPGSGVKAAVRQLITHSWPVATTAAAATARTAVGAAGSDVHSGISLQQRPGTSEGMLIMPVPGGLSANQLGACVHQQYQLHAATAAAASAAAPVPGSAAVAIPRSSNSGPEKRGSYYRSGSESGSVASGGATYRSSRIAGLRDRRQQLSATGASKGAAEQHGKSAAAVVAPDSALLMYVEDWGFETAGGSSTTEWMRQLLDAGGCTVVRRGVSLQSTAPTRQAATGAEDRGVRAGHLCDVLAVPRPQLLAMTANPPSADTRSSSLLRHMMLFNAECVCALPDSCIPSNSSNSKALSSSTATTAPLNGNCLVSRKEVLSALFQHYGPHIPRVHEVTKPKLLQGLESVMWGLTTTLNCLQQQQLVPTHCCFDTRHYRHSIESVLALCADHLGHLDSKKGLGPKPDNQPEGLTLSVNPAAAVLNPQQSTNPRTPYGLGPKSPWGAAVDPNVAQLAKTPKTPHTPGFMTLVAGASFAEGVLGPGGLGSRRISLKTLCNVMVEVLSRCVSDAAETSEQQRSLQRLVLLLVVSHIAVIDQPPPSNNSTLTGSSSKTGSSSAPAGAQGQLAAPAPAAAANTALTRPTSTAVAGLSSKGDNSSNWISEMLSKLCSIQPASNRRSTATRSQGGASSKDQTSTAAWQQLQQMTDSAFTEAVKASLLPRGVPNRVLLQMVHMAALGRDPVLSMEPLHVAAAQQELQQLLMQQTATATATAAAANHRYLTVSASEFGSQGPSETLQHPSISLDGLPGLPRPRVSTVMSPVDVHWASKLLPCSAFAATAHKLMWWLQNSQGQQVLGESAASDTKFVAAQGFAGLGLGGAAAGVALQDSAQGSGASIAILAGLWRPGTHAVAATAAAALGASMLQISGEDIAAADNLIAQAVLDAAAAATAAEAERVRAALAAAADARRSSTSSSIAEAPAAAAQQSSSSVSATVYRVSSAVFSTGVPAGMNVGECEAVDLAPVEQLPQQVLLVVMVDLHGSGVVDSRTVQLLQRWSAKYPCTYSVQQLLQQQFKSQHDLGAQQGTSQGEQQQQQEPMPLCDWSKLSRVQQQQMMHQQQQQQQTLQAPASATTAADGMQAQRVKPHPAARAVGMCIVVLCTPEQQHQLLAAVPSLQQDACNMLLPSAQLPEQLTADCRAQLMAGSGWALLEHVKDAHTLFTQQQKQQQQQEAASIEPDIAAAGAAAASSSGSPEQQPGKQAPQQQTQQQKQGSSSGQVPSSAGAAMPTESAARRLADRLAAALAAIHWSAFAAYETHYDTHLSTSSSSSDSSANSSSSRAVNSPGRSSSSSAQLATQALPLSKPFDVLQLLPQLITEAKQPLITRRAALASCLAKISKTQQVLEQQISKDQQQSKTLVQPSLTSSQQQQQQKQQAGYSVRGGGMEADLLGVRLQVLAGLRADLQKLSDTWQHELHNEVAVRLTQVLPNALLAALELVYLGALPAAVQQQLLPSWQQQIAAAVDGDTQLGVSKTATTTAAAAAAATAGFFVSESSSSSSSTDSPGLPRGRFLLQLLGQGTLAAAAAAVPADSELIEQLKLLQPQGPLWQQIRFAAAAANLTAQSGVPLLVTDPWNLLPQVLPEVAVGQHQMISAAAADSSDDSSSSSGGWRVISTTNMEDVTVQDQVGRRARFEVVLKQLQAAFAAGSSVCLQLLCDSSSAANLAAAAAAMHTGQQLQAAAEAADEDLSVSTSPNSPDQPSAAAAGSSSSRRLASQSARANARARISSACSTRSRGTSAIGRQGLRGPGVGAPSDDVGFSSPKLVIQVVSNVFKMTAELAGLCQVIDLGGLLHDCSASNRYASNNNSQPGSQQQQQQQVVTQQRQRFMDSTSHNGVTDIASCSYLPEMMLRLLLETVAGKDVRIVAAAAEASECCQQQYADDESKLMRRLTQDLMFSSTTPVLLESLATSARDLASSAADSARLSAAAAATAAQLAAAWQPLAAASAETITEQQYACREQDYVIPWEFVQSAVKWSVTLAAATSSSSSSSRRSSSDGADMAESPAAARAAARAGEQQSGTAEPVITTDVSILQPEVVITAVAELQKQLVIPLPLAVRQSLPLHWQQQQQHPEPDAMVLCRVLEATPVAVPIVVASHHIAAGAALVRAAAAAAGRNSSGNMITVRASELALAAADDADHHITSRTALLEQCRSIIAAGLSAQHRQGKKQQHRQQQQQQPAVWLVMLLDENLSPVVQAAVQAVQEITAMLQQAGLEQQKLDKQRIAIPDSIILGQKTGAGTLRLWVVAHKDDAAAFCAAAGGSCLLYRAATNQPEVIMSRSGLANAAAAAAAATGVNQQLGCTTAASAASAADLMGALLQAEAAVQNASALQLLPGSAAGAAAAYAAANLEPMHHFVFAESGPAGRIVSRVTENARDSRVMCILQPLLFAAVKARCMWQQQLAISSSSGLKQSTPADADLHGPWDLAHLYLLLQRIAVATEAATFDQSTESTSNSSGTSKPLKSLKHLTHLPIDLLQLRKLLMWAVLGPSCTSNEARDIAQGCLQESLTAASLAARSWDVGGSPGLQVLGDVIADTWEQVDEQLARDRLTRHRQQYGSLQYTDAQAAAGAAGAASSDSGRRSSTEDAEGVGLDGGDRGVCVLPLGMKLDLEQLWALLQSYIYATNQP